MTAAQYGNVPQNPAGQYNGLLGGNPELAARDLGHHLVRSSCSVRQSVTCRIAIDYFDIEIEDTISSTAGGNADTYINSCLDTGDAAFCDLIQRDELRFAVAVRWRLTSSTRA